MEAATPVLAEYGALGVVLLFAGVAIRILFARETEAHKREQERADRMEQEVRRLNEVILTRLLPIVHEATKAISEALQEQQRRRDR